MKLIKALVAWVSSLFKKKEKDKPSTTPTTPTNS